MDNGIIDIEGLKKRLDGDLELLSEILEIFLSRYVEVMAKIRKAIVSHDAKALEAAAHNLRGYLVSIHAIRAADTALELEIKGRHNEWLYAEEIFSNLEREMELLAPMLETTVAPRP